MKSILVCSVLAAATCAGKPIKLPKAVTQRPNPYRMIVTEPDGTLTTYDVALTNAPGKSWKLRTVDENIVFFFVNANGKYEYEECDKASLVVNSGEIESLGSAYRKYDMEITGNDPNMTQASKKAEAMAILYTAESVPKLAATEKIQVCDTTFFFTEFDREVVKWFAAKYRERPVPEPEPVPEAIDEAEEGEGAEETPKEDPPVDSGE